MPFRRNKNATLEGFDKSWREAVYEYGLTLLRNLRQFEDKMHTDELKKRLERYLDIEYGHITKKQKLSGDFAKIWFDTTNVATQRLEQDLRLGRFHLQLGASESRNEFADKIMTIVKNTLNKQNNYDIEKQSIPKEFAKTGNTAADKLLEQGTANMLRLSYLCDQINCTDIKNNIKRLLATSSQIFDFISKNPEKSRKLHEFMDYYYPTVLKLLESYIDLNAKAIKGDNIHTSLAQITVALEKIEPAFTHQLDILFSDTSLDIKTDIIALENIMKQAGL
jgi:5-bromo-4-chloroindolyl phosphate hydrolysis protein